MPRSKHPFLTQLLAAALLAFLPGCFEAADPGEQWSLGRPDDRLVGQWTDEKDHPAVIVHRAGHSLRIQMLDDDGNPEPPEKELFGRTVSVHGQHILLTASQATRDAASPRVGIYPYTTDGDTLTFFLITREGGEELRRRMPEKGVEVKGETFFSVEVARLTAAHLEVASTMVGNEAFFSRTGIRKAK